MSRKLGTKLVALQPATTIRGVHSLSSYLKYITIFWQSLHVNYQNRFKQKINVFDFLTVLFGKEYLCLDCAHNYPNLHEHGF